MSVFQGFSEIACLKRQEFYGDLLIRLPFPLIHQLIIGSLFSTGGMDLQSRRLCISSWMLRPKLVYILGCLGNTKQHVQGDFPVVTGACSGVKSFTSLVTLL